MGRPKKDPFAGISESERTELDNLNEQELRNRISAAAMAEIENKKTRDDDQDLAEKKFAAKEAGAVYKEATARHNSIIAYSKSLLEARGKA